MLTMMKIITIINIWLMNYKQALYEIYIGHIPSYTRRNVIVMTILFYC